MICDLCKTDIERGEPYSLTEFGRLHSRCLRETAAHSPVNGPILPVYDLAGSPERLERRAPLYVLRRQ